MRLRKIKNAELLCKEFKNNYILPHDFAHFLENKKYVSLNLEIGCGQSIFLVNQANKYIDNLWIGIDKEPTVIYKSLKLLSENQNNIIFISSFLEKFILIFKQTKKKLQNIYINFPDPWPKKRHEKRRLTYLSYLNEYHLLLRKNGYLELKTDDWNLFLFSIRNIAQTKFKIINIMLNYNNSSTKSDQTKYEIKFLKKNKNLYYLKLQK